MACGISALLLFAFVAAAGDSAAVPGLGPRKWHPAWDLALGLNSASVTAILAAGYVGAAVSVALGLWAIRDGAVLLRKHLLLAGTGVIGAVLVLTALPPAGSADHLSYLAYGRIAAAGDDPYTQDPLAWRGGLDPVAGAIQPPWQHTPSVYGPVTTAVQAAVAALGGGDLRLTVWFWQLLMGAVFVAAGYTLDRLTRHDPAARTRAAVIWTLNPLLLAELVLGGHIDVLAVAAALAAMALAARRPLLAGIFLGVAVGSKVTFALFGLAIVIGLVKNAARWWRPVGTGLLGTALVLVPAHLWSGAHTYDQLRAASRFISLATPWRLVADLLDPVFGRPPVRSVVGPVAIALGVLLAIALVRRVSRVPVGVAASDHATRDIIRAGFALAVAWVLTTPYALPWYDAMVWAPLALLGAGGLDVVLLARLAVLSLAYVPGRVVEMSAGVQDLTLGFRRHVAPWLTLLVLIGALAWSFASGRWRRPALRRRAAEEPVR